MRARAASFSAERRLRPLREFVAAARVGGVAALFARLSLQASAQYTICVLPMGRTVRLAMGGLALRVTAKGKPTVTYALAERVSQARARAIYDPLTRTYWIQKFTSLGAYICFDVPWCVQRYLSTIRFPKTEIARGDDFVVRLMPRRPFEHMQFEEIYQANFSRARGLLAEPRSPGAPNFRLYYRCYMRKLRVKFVLRVTDNCLCAADGDRLFESEHIARRRCIGFIELGVRWGDAARVARFLGAKANPEFPIEAGLRRGLLRFERRCARQSKRPIASRFALIQLLESAVFKLTLIG